MTPSIVDAHIITCQSVHLDLTLTLINELLEGVLAICTRLSPQNRATGIVHVSPLAGHRLPVGLHVTEVKNSCFHLHVTSIPCVHDSLECTTCSQ